MSLAASGPAPGAPRQGLRLGRRRVEFPGGPAAFLERGSGGVPLLLVHGFGGDALSWQFNLTALAADRRVLAVDLPGHGESTDDPGGGGIDDLADWLARFMDAAGLAVADVVGHSMGARIALSLAGRHPGRVRRMTLLACAGLGASVDLGFLGAMRAVATREEALAAVDRLFGSPFPHREAFAKALLSRMGEPAAAAALGTILEHSAAAIRAGGAFAWERLAVPAQLVWGTADTVVPPPDPAAVPGRIPLHRLDGIGHMPHVEAASRVNALIKEFHA